MLTEKETTLLPSLPSKYKRSHRPSPPPNQERQSCTPTAMSMTGCDAPASLTLRYRCRP
ncbi:MAG: hypothetical protein V7L11_26825 [Nostoc sp.]|uniref:hypothetical protein n=1 Tax=Nostoc sp. TaxID=1180 RepID=UPI002FF5F463